jgi:hypothetical protein
VDAEAGLLKQEELRAELGVKTLRNDQREAPNAEGAAAVDERIFAWDDPPNTLKDDILAGVAKDLGYESVEELNDALDANPDLLKGYTVRVILIGYSYGAWRAIQEADLLYEAIDELGMVPEIHLRTIDAIDADTHPDGLAVTQGPTNKMKSFANGYQQNIWPKGGPIDGAAPDVNLSEKTADHLSIDDDVLGPEGGAAEEVARLELAPFGHEAAREVDTFP